MPSEVDWGRVADFLQVVGGLGGVIALVVVFWLKGTFVSKADYEADKKVAAVDHRTLLDQMALFNAAQVEIKAALKSLPEIQELHLLAMSLERLNGTVGALDTKLNGFGDLMDRLSTMVDRHEEHLLDRKG